MPKPPQDQPTFTYQPLHVDMTNNVTRRLANHRSTKTREAQERKRTDTSIW